jgi:hypothetical protein
LRLGGDAIPLFLGVQTKVARFVISRLSEPSGAQNTIFEIEISVVSTIDASSYGTRGFLPNDPGAHASGIGRVRLFIGRARLSPTCGSSSVGGFVVVGGSARNSEWIRSLAPAQRSELPAQTPHITINLLGGLFERLDVLLEKLLAIGVFGRLVDCLQVRAQLGQALFHQVVE